MKPKIILLNGFRRTTFGFFASRRLADAPSVSGNMVGLGRVELPTSPLSGVRSSQLSYRPMWALRPDMLVELVGIEPATS